MRYFSIDIETSSLEPKPEHILGLSIVFEDTSNPLPLLELPHCTCIIRQPVITGQPYALSMNAWILESMATGKSKYPIVNSEECWAKVKEFIGYYIGTKRAVAAGKNVAGFDLQFFPKEAKDLFIHRTIDPGPMFIDWEDSRPPDLSAIKKKVGLDPSVSHDMYQDALDVIAVLRTTYNK